MTGVQTCALPISSRNGTPILIRDVAQIKLGAVPRLGTTAQDNDDDAVIGIVIMRKGENPSVVLKAVKEKIAVLNERRIRTGSISKYCLGLISTHAGLRKNNFVEQIRHFQRILNDAA